MATASSEQKVIVVDFGAQYGQLIARRVRDLHVYSEIVPCDVTADEVRAIAPAAIILSGGPASVYAEDAPSIDPEILKLGIPVLGFCYGQQIMAVTLGGEVGHTEKGEYGPAPLTRCDEGRSALYGDTPAEQTVWMSHRDAVSEVPEGFTVTASTDVCPVAAMECVERKIFTTQFHPEVNHTEYGQAMLRNFLYEVCGATGDWTMGDFMRKSIEDIRAKVGDGKVLLALSGGVDSSVAAALLAEAVGNQLTCIFVDHGLLRKNEGDEVEAAFKNWDINLVRVNAEERFLTRLKDVSDPETKRKIIGEEFIRVFEEEGKKIGSVDYLAQGTIYPDVIESGTNVAAVIKSHHNVGGLPDFVDFKEIIEPLRLLFKDEVRALGRELGLPEYLVMRQPFPGPGLAIRCLGAVSKDKLDILRDADFIFRDEIAKAHLEQTMNQYFAVLTNMRSVGVMGDGRTYDYTLALRSVTTTDFMTANWTRIPYDVLDRVSVRIVNEVKGINRIVYDITSKPPATIEWE